MTDQSSHDAWSAGESYEQYMGRWSRLVAASFLNTLNSRQNLDWLDLGCGTGALSQCIFQTYNPKSVTGVELSDGFLASARAAIPDKRAIFKQGDAQNIPLEDNSVDICVSALTLNFLPDKLKALAEMQRVTKNGGRVAFYVWDYPGGGMEMINQFWKAATKLNANAVEFDEASRFPFCTAVGLKSLSDQSGLKNSKSYGVVVETLFRNFDDFWAPFTMGAGPAPGYYANLATDQQTELRELLKSTLKTKDDGSISLLANAWAINAIVEK